MARSAIFIATALLLLAATSPGRTLPPEPPISVGTCIEHGGSVDQPEGSAIRACCLDSDITGIRGCYICDNNWKNCVWDPAYRNNLPVGPGRPGTKQYSPVLKTPGKLAPAQ
jgi:hypothetical protein